MDYTCLHGFCLANEKDSQCFFTWHATFHPWIKVLEISILVVHVWVCSIRSPKRLGICFHLVRHISPTTTDRRLSRGEDGQEGGDGKAQPRNYPALPGNVALCCHGNQSIEPGVCGCGGGGWGVVLTTVTYGQSPAVLYSRGLLS